MDFIAGKIAIITGAANGIGEACVKRLFKSGMKCCTIADIDEKGQALVKQIECCYGKDRAIFVKADVTNRRAFENVFQTTLKKYDKLDVLINNAGIRADSIWEKMIDLNINSSTVIGSLLGIKYMGKNNGFHGGTVVNVSSIYGLKGTHVYPCYTGTKHFIIGFTRSIGSKFWFDLTEVRFMTMCPGVTVTNAPPELSVFEDFPGLRNCVVERLEDATMQTPGDVAEGLNTMLNEGENGSIWVVADAEPVYEVVIPPIHAMKKNVCQRP